VNSLEFHYSAIYFHITITNEFPHNSRRGVKLPW